MDETEFQALFGSELYAPSTKSTVPTADALNGKTVLIYFSAHWCPPCGRFTPVLIDLYKKVQSEASSNMELVFCSLDNTDKEYDAYTSTMPWKCIPFEGTAETRNKLAVKYGAQGIPHLVVISPERTIITQEGTEEVQMDPEGKNFPWKPKSFREMWPKQYITKSGLVESSTLDSKYLMLYFSAHWCPPCKMFSPTLGKAYQTMKSGPNADEFELVFVSSDRDQESFDEYYGTMPFCALPFADREAKTQLSKRFGIRGIPSVLILGPMNAETGERPLINENLRGIIEAGEFSDFPFVPKNYQDLGYGADGINEHKSIVVLCESEDDDEQAEIIAAIKEVAESDGSREYRFFYATQPAGITNSIRKLIKREKEMGSVIMALLDIPDNGGYYLSTETDITVDSIRKFLASPGTRQQMSN